MCSTAYLVALWDRILDVACGRLHAVAHGLVCGRRRGQDAVLESLRAAGEAPLLGRKYRFLFLQAPFHFELMLEGAERPADETTSAWRPGSHVFTGPFFFVILAQTLCLPFHLNGDKDSVKNICTFR